MKFAYIDDSKKEEWEKLVASNPATGFMQSFAWTKFTNFLGWETFKIGAFDDHQLIGGAMVGKFTFEDGNYLYIPQGPVIAYQQKEAEQIFHQLIAEVDQIANLKGENLTSHLRIDPKLTNLPKFFKRFQKAALDKEPLKTILIDLSYSKDYLLQQMKPKGRYNVKLAQRYGIKVISTNLKFGLKDFLKFYTQTVERKQFKGQDEIYFAKLIPCLEEEKLAKFYFAKYRNTILASALVVFYGDFVTFLFGASSNVHREKMAPYLLQWQMILEAKKLGYKYYDFYGIAPTDDLSHSWQGFSQFKRKFGGEEVKYIGAYDFIYNKKLYQQYLKEQE